MVVAAITAGVCMFSAMGHQSSKKSTEVNTTKLGALYLAVNLLLDGFYNTAQDNMFFTNKDLTGAHMMCGLNAVAAAVSALFLASGMTPELKEAIAFINAHPAVLKDITLFGACGALGQIFIFQTLEAYGSLTLVAVTVTRKMISIVFSVVMFNHKLSHGQYVGAALVFGGLAVEAAFKMLHDKAARKKQN
jgi:UDP-galactose transporter B1